MSDPDDLAPCSMCSAPVNREQLSSGMAVRVSGEVVCPHCVDLLPTDAKVRINQLRALRGQASTPYRYRFPRHPQLKAYTYSNSAQLMRHRRLLNEGKELEAPEIAPRGSADRPLGARPPAAPIATGPALGRRRRMLAVGAVAGGLLVLLVVVSIAALSGGDEAAPPNDPATDPDAIAGPQALRRDYPQAALEAWDLARSELPVDHPVLAAIAGELSAERNQQLDLAQQAVAEGQLLKARDLLDRMRIERHYLLNTLERRENDLRSSLAEAEAAARAAPEPVIPPALPLPPPEPEPAVVALPPPTPEEPASVEAAEPEAPAVAPAPPSTAPPPPPPVWLATAADLLAGESHSDWSLGAAGELQLVGPAALAARTIEAPAGPLRLWVELLTPPGDGAALLGRVGSGILRPATALAPGWIAFEPMVEDSGPQALELLAQGDGISLGRLALTTGDEPPDDTTEAQPLDWIPAQPTDRDEAVTPLSPRFGRDVLTLDALTPGSLVPAGLPGGAGPEVVTSGEQKRKQVIEVPLEGIDITAGGLAVLLHPSRDPDRLELVATLVDSNGQRVDTQPVIFSGPSWHTALLSVPQLPPERFDASSVRSLELRDATTEPVQVFYLAKVVAVRGRSPVAGDLGTHPRALRIADAESLERLLQGIAEQRRRRGDWRELLDFDKLRLLCGHQLVNGSWQTQVYDHLERLTGSRPKRGTLAPLMMYDPWLDENFIIDKVIGDRRYHLVVVATGGIEFPTGLTVDQALHNFWIKMIEESVASGMLPVVVLGPTKLVPAQHPLAEELWTRLDAVLQQTYPAIPVIDLRPVGVADYARFGPGQAEQSAAMLSSGVVELQTRLKLLRDAKAKGRR